VTRRETTMSYDICPKCARPTFRCECHGREPIFGEAPIRPEHVEVMNDIARRIEDAITESGQKGQIGFALLVFDFGSGGFMNYISNAERNTMLQAMREFIDRNIQRN
jgi:hypothetical protein